MKRIINLKLQNHISILNKTFLKAPNKSIRSTAGSHDTATMTKLHDLVRK